VKRSKCARGEITDGCVFFWFRAWDVRDTQEDYCQNLIMSVGPMCPVEALVAAVEKRNRLKMLLPWLEARAAEGAKDQVLYNALGKPRRGPSSGPFHTGDTVATPLPCVQPQLSALSV